MFVAGNPGTAPPQQVLQPGKEQRKQTKLLPICETTPTPKGANRRPPAAVAMATASAREAILLPSQ